MISFINRLQSPKDGTILSDGEALGFVMSDSVDMLLVMLPNSGAFMPSLGLASVRASLQKGGWSASILDLDYEFSCYLRSESNADTLSKFKTFDNWVFPERFNQMLPGLDALLDDYTRQILMFPSDFIGFSVNVYNNWTTGEVVRRIIAAGDTRQIIVGGHQLLPGGPHELSFSSSGRGHNRGSR